MLKKYICGKKITECLLKQIIDLARQRFFNLLSERKEKLLRDLAKLRVRIDTFNDYSDMTQLDDYFKVVKSTMMRIADHYKERDKINEEEDMFGISVSFLFMN